MMRYVVGYAALLTYMTVLFLVGMRTAWTAADESDADSLYDNSVTGRLVISW